jgi:membrane-bound lytic murein transglycosylase
MAVASKTVEKHVLHWHQLYEQQKQKKATSVEMAFVLDCYVNRWQRWVAAGLQGIKIDVYEQNLNQRYLSLIALS